MKDLPFVLRFPERHTKILRGRSITLSLIMVDINGVSTDRYDLKPVKFTSSDCGPSGTNLIWTHDNANK